MPTRWQSDLALVRAFLARFFENEVTAGAHDLKASLFWLIALLALPGAVAPLLIGLASMPPSSDAPDPSLWGWAMIARYQGVEALRVISRADKTLYLGFAMVASAIVSAVTWSSVLPERRDALVLGVLPVRSSKIIAAKLAALAAYVMVVSVAMHALASVSFGFFLAAENTMVFAARGMAAHFLSSTAASAFVCLVVIAVQGLALVIAGPKLFARVSAAMQFVLVGVVVLGLVAMPAISKSVVDSLAGHGSHAQPWILNTPPLWFLGVYEWVIGGPGAPLTQLAERAFTALAFLLVTIVVTYPLACRRLLVDAIERPDGMGRIGPLSGVAGIIARLSGSSSDVRGVAQYFLATLGRVGPHRFVMAIAIGTAAAWCLPAWMTLSTSLPSAPRTDLLSLPIAAMFFVLVGLRMAAALPSDISAAWLFEVHTPSRVTIRQALERTMFMLAVVPIVTVSTAVYWYLWGQDIALVHAACALSVGLAFTQAILWRFDDVPCAAPWRPPSGHVRKWWPVYLIVLAFVTRGVPALEGLVLKFPFLAVIFIAWMMAMARITRAKALAPRPVRDGESADVLTSALRSAAAEVRRADRASVRDPLAGQGPAHPPDDGGGEERWFDQFNVRPQEVWRDVRLGWRRLRLAPGFTAFSIVSLALGLGMTTAAYSAMYDFLWRPLGVPGSDAIVTVRTNTYPPQPVALSWPDVRDLQKLPRVFDRLAAFGPVFSSLAANGRAELVTGQAVSGEFFQVFAVRPALGRLIQSEDDRTGASAVIVLAHTTWRNQLGADPDIVGKVVKVGDQPFTVIGVTPPIFRGTTPGRAQAFWVPLTAAPGLAKWLGRRNDPTDRSGAWLTVAGRLPRLLARETASAGVEALSKQLDAALPLPARQGPAGTAVRSPPRAWRLAPLVEISSLRTGRLLGILLIALPVLVLLVACTNLANLVLSRGWARRHEFAVRRALGASRWSLIRELLVEVGTVAVVGAAGGLLVTRVLLTWFITTVQQNFGYKPALQLDPEFEPFVFAAAAAAMLLALFVAGFVPALQLTGVRSMRRALSADTDAALPSWRGRRALIAVQVAVSVGLFLIATVLFRQIGVERQAEDPNLDGISVAQVPFDLQQRDATRVRQTLDGVLTELQTFPDVGAAAATTLYQNRATTVVRLDDQTADFFVGTPGLFRTLGLATRSGRTFDDRDVAGGPPSIVINESLAKQVFGTAEAAGRRPLMRFTYVRLGLIDPATLPSESVTVVGVVADRLPGSPGRKQFEVYAPFTQREAFDVGILARASDGRRDLGPALRTAIHRADPELAVSFAGRLDVMLGGPAAVLGIAVAIAGSLATLALMLSMAGLYGVLSHITAGRSREMGLRIALGAGRHQIMRLVFVDGLRPVGEGLCLGLGIAIVVRGILQTMFTSTLSSLDLTGVLIAVTPLIVAAGAACYVPARRAARAEPGRTLRDL